MVHCLVVGCFNRSGRSIGVSFYRIPKVVYGRSKKEEDLSRRRREGYLAAIYRADLTESIIENGRICSEHFRSSKPAALFDETNPSWLPTEKLGHSKLTSRSRQSAIACEERYLRKKARSERLDAARTIPMVANESEREKDTENIVDEGSSNYINQDEVENVEPEESLPHAQPGICSEVQTELTSKQIFLTQQELNTAYAKINLLEARLSKFLVSNF